MPNKRLLQTIYKEDMLASVEGGEALEAQQLTATIIPAAFQSRINCELKPVKVLPLL